VRYHESTSAPRCSACGSRHYPATLGNGRRVWCDGSPAESEQEHHERTRARESANRRAEQEERDYIAWRREQEREREQRERFRAEHAERMRAERPKCGERMDDWSVPDSLPPEL